MFPSLCTQNSAQHEYIHTQWLNTQRKLLNITINPLTAIGWKQDLYDWWIWFITVHMFTKHVTIYYTAKTAASVQMRLLVSRAQQVVTVVPAKLAEPPVSWRLGGRLQPRSGGWPRDRSCGTTELDGPMYFCLLLQYYNKYDNITKNT